MAVVMIEKGNLISRSGFKEFPVVIFNEENLYFEICKVVR